MHRMLKGLGATALVVGAVLPTSVQAFGGATVDSSIWPQNLGGLSSCRFAVYNDSSNADAYVRIYAQSSDQYAGGSGWVSGSATSYSTITAADILSICAVDAVSIIAQDGADNGSYAADQDIGIKFAAIPSSGTTSYTYEIGLRQGVPDAIVINTRITTTMTDQAITGLTLPSTILVDESGAITASGGGSPNPVIFSSQTPSVCTVAGSTLSAIAAGTCTVAANQAGDALYNAAPQVTDSFTVIDGSPVIGGSSSGQAVNDTSTVAPFSAVTLADGNGENLVTTVSLDTNAKGIFTAASLSASGFSGTGPYTLSSSTPAAAQAAIRHLVFDPADNRVAAGSTETTTFTISADDGTEVINDSVTTVVSTSVNDAPQFTADATLGAVNEDTAAPAGATVTALLNSYFSDVDLSASLAGIAVSADASVNGVEGDWQYSSDGSTWYEIGTVSTASALLLDLNSKLRFVPYTNYNGVPGSLTVYAVDSSSATTFTSGSSRQTFDATADDATSKVSAAGVAVGTSITAVNDSPLITNLNGDAVSFNVGGFAVALDNGADAGLADVDSTDFNGATVTVAGTTNYLNTEDVLQVGNVGNVAISGSNVIHADSGGLIIGTFTGGTAIGSNNPMVITLNANATLARVRDLLSALQYYNATSSSLLTRTVTINVTDGDGGVAATQSVTVSLVTAPDVDLNGAAAGIDLAASYTEGDGAVLVVPAATASDADGDNLDQLLITLTNPQASDTISLAGRSSGDVVNGITITYNSASQVTLSGSTSGANYQALLRELQFENSSDVPDTTARVITAQAINADVGTVATLTLSVTAVNDPVTGSVSITGTAMQWQTLNISNTLTDPDGLGSFSYQWLRDGGDITGATGVSYTLTLADVGANISVQVSFVDGGGTAESVTSSATSAVAGDLDGDTIADASDPDIDGDGMSNVYEDANGLDRLDASDRDTDLDGDGVSNYDESVASSNANADDYPPVLTPPADITTNATGLLTSVAIGNASAVDAVDGAVAATVTMLNGKAVSSTPVNFKPGINTVTWSSSDVAGNSTSADQQINVVPLVNFAKGQVSAEGATVSFRAFLNGPAVSYPVSVPYTVSGSASTDGSDHNLSNGTITITDPDVETSVSFTLVDDGAGEGVENIVITMGAPTNAVAGAQTTHTIQVYESNVAPVVALSADQNSSGTTRIVTQTGGVVVVSATATDPNVADTHSYDWSLSDNALVDTDSVDDTFSFDPSALSPGYYRLTIAVSDGSDSSTVSLLLNVQASAPVLNGLDDTDADGSDDLSEGFVDSDGDGIPDYLDAIAAASVLQSQQPSSDSYLVEALPGLGLSLGDVAFQSGLMQAAISMSDVSNAGGSSDDSRYHYDEGLFDLVISGGQSVTLVIPQLAPIPASATFRVLTLSGWQDFVVDADNSIASAPGAAGYCPPPGDAAYQPGLAEGDLCVQVTLTDGGPNDADGVSNNRAAILGGVSTDSGVTTTTTGTTTGDSSGSGGGGTLSPLLFTLLLSLLVYRTRKQRGAAC